MAETAIWAAGLAAVALVYLRLPFVVRIRTAKPPDISGTANGDIFRFEFSVEVRVPPIGELRIHRRQRFCLRWFLGRAVWAPRSFLCPVGDGRLPDVCRIFPATPP